MGGKEGGVYLHIRKSSGYVAGSRRKRRRKLAAADSNGQSRWRVEWCFGSWIRSVVRVTDKPIPFEFHSIPPNDLGKEGGARHRPVGGGGAPVSCKFSCSRLVMMMRLGLARFGSGWVWLQSRWTDGSSSIGSHYIYIYRFIYIYIFGFFICLLLFFWEIKSHAGFPSTSWPSFLQSCYMCI